MANLGRSGCWAGRDAGPIGSMGCWADRRADPPDAGPIGMLGRPDPPGLARRRGLALPIGRRPRVRGNGHAPQTGGVAVIARAVSCCGSQRCSGIPPAVPAVAAEVPAACCLAARPAADRVAADLLASAPAAEVARGVRRDARRVPDDAQRALLAQRGTRHQVGLRHALRQAGRGLGRHRRGGCLLRRSPACVGRVRPVQVRRGFLVVAGEPGRAGRREDQQVAVALGRDRG